MTDDQFLAMLTRHEGTRKTVYRDSRGYWTIGVGFLIDPSVPGAGLTDEEIKAVLNIRVDAVYNELIAREPWIANLSSNRMAVLLDMAYNLGEAHLESFKNTLAFIKNGDYNQAAMGMLNSLWAKQVGARATELADMMRNG